MLTITAICQRPGRQEEGFLNDVLIYTVQVRDPDNYEEVQGAVQIERERDLGDDVEVGEVTVLFTFQGDISPRSDFRS